MKERTISLSAMNLLGVVVMPVVVGIIIFLYFKMNPDMDVKQTIKAQNIGVVLGIFILSTLMHELIHGLCFAKFAKSGCKAIKFGIMWKSLAPYCHCKEFVVVWQYRVVVLMPTVILGFIPVIIGFALSNFMLVLVSAVMIVAGIGDFMTLWMCRDLDKNSLIMDHPNQVGFYYG